MSYLISLILSPSYKCEALLISFLMEHYETPRLQVSLLTPLIPEAFSIEVSLGELIVIITCESIFLAIVFNQSHSIWTLFCICHCLYQVFALSIVNCSVVLCFVLSCQIGYIRLLAMLKWPQLRVYKGIISTTMLVVHFPFLFCSFFYNSTFFDPNNLIILIHINRNIR